LWGLTHNGGILLTANIVVVAAAVALNSTALTLITTAT
jgi:hypothetical protein